jgi:hypothetical protein
MHEYYSLVMDSYDDESLLIDFSAHLIHRISREHLRIIGYL